VAAAANIHCLPLFSMNMLRGVDGAFETAVGTGRTHSRSLPLHLCRLLNVRQATPSQALAGLRARMPAGAALRAAASLPSFACMRWLWPRRSRHVSSLWRTFVRLQGRAGCFLALRINTSALPPWRALCLQHREHCFLLAAHLTAAARHAAVETMFLLGMEGTWRACCMGRGMDSALFILLPRIPPCFSAFVRIACCLHLLLTYGRKCCGVFKALCAFLPCCYSLISSPLYGSCLSSASAVNILALAFPMLLLYASIFLPPSWLVTSARQMANFGAGAARQASDIFLTFHSWPCYRRRFLLSLWLRWLRSTRASAWRAACYLYACYACLLLCISLHAAVLPPDQRSIAAVPSVRL